MGKERQTKTNVKRAIRAYADTLPNDEILRFRVSGYMTGASLYITDEFTGVSLRVSDHEAPTYGGYNQDTGERAGAADVQIDDHGGLPLGWWKIGVAAYLQMVENAEAEMDCD